MIVSILLTQNKGENFYYPWEITQLSASYSDNLEFGNFQQKFTSCSLLPWGLMGNKVCDIVLYIYILVTKLKKKKFWN